MNTDEPSRSQRSAKGVFQSLRSPLRNVLPFLCFYVILLTALYASHTQTRSPVSSSRFGASSDQIVLLQKDPRSNRTKRIQLEHTLQNAMRHRVALRAAQEAMDKKCSSENRETLLFWQEKCVEDQRAYSIIVAETDDSLFAQTNLPRELPQ